MKNDLPITRIDKSKEYIAMALHTLGKDDTDPRDWPTLEYDISKKGGNSGSCEVILMNATERSLYDGTTLLTAEGCQEQRFQLARLV